MSTSGCQVRRNHMLILWFGPVTLNRHGKLSKKSAMLSKTTKNVRLRKYQIIPTTLFRPICLATNKFATSRTLPIFSRCDHIQFISHRHDRTLTMSGE